MYGVEGLRVCEFTPERLSVELLGERAREPKHGATKG